jgi:hypothetical protein
VRELRAERVYAQGLGRSLRDPHYVGVAGVTRVDQGGDPLGVGNRGLEQLQPLPRYLRPDEKGQAGEIAAWVRETGDQPGSAKGYPDDRERRGRLFGRINHAATKTFGPSRAKSAARSGRRSTCPSA